MGSAARSGLETWDRVECIGFRVLLLTGLYRRKRPRRVASRGSGVASGVSSGMTRVFYVAPVAFSGGPQLNRFVFWGSEG